MKLIFNKVQKPLINYYIMLLNSTLTFPIIDKIELVNEKGWVCDNNTSMKIKIRLSGDKQFEFIKKIIQNQ